ncbi:MAG TPA: AMP-binding protein [Casimicrobiaceae bacterium]|jgi:acyl-CoA synthetase (AMP-forming)/AMP-acid ligase II/acyl carrier protein
MGIDARHDRDTDQMESHRGPKSATVASTIGGVIDYWARVAPDAPAIAARERRDMSYAELALRTDTIAGQLQHAGFGPHSRLALVHRGGAEAFTTILGVVKRAIAVPVSDEYSASELGSHFDACGAEAVIVDARLDGPIRDVASARGMRVIDVGSGRDEDAAGHVTLDLPLLQAHSLADPARADHTAFVFGTSGTTRASKLVPLRHRHMVCRSESTALLHELTQDDRCFNQNRLFLCSGISNSCTALFAGGCVVHPDEFGRFDLRAFIESLMVLRPTWYVASYNFNVAVYQTLKDDASAVAGHGLRFIRPTSGHLAPEVVVGLEKIFGVPVIEAYSSTESGRICGNPLPPRRRKPGSVGLPTVHSDVSIIDDRGHPVKQGDQGEVVVRGENVFDGYDRNPTANDEAFRGDWYRTGDLGVFDEDGYLRLVGRIREMINRGGQKISPVEIDEALVAHPEIADAAAFAVPHPTLGEVAAAAVVRGPNSRLSNRDIAVFLRQRLEPIKLPRTFVFVDEIPRGLSGKARRSEMIKLFEQFGPISQSAQSPLTDDMATPTETRLAQLWKWLLQRDQLGPNDDFFLLGGDSLAATQLVLTANEVFDVELGIDLIFSDASTIRTMAAMIDQRKGRPKTGRNPDLPLGSIDERIGRPSAADRVDPEKHQAKHDAEVFDLFVLEKSTGLRRMRPGARYASVQSNSQGYRSPEVPLAKPAGTIRLAFLGDSFAFGSWNGGNETTWPFHAIETLRLAPGGWSYDYINAAMPGNGIGHVTIQFRESIAKFRPDIIAIAPGASGNAADWARQKIGYSGIHYMASWLARRFGPVGWIEKNLVVLLRQLRALSDRGKLTFEPHELRDISKEFQGKLRDLVTECQKSGALVVLFTRESRIQRCQGKVAQIWASGSRLFYQPYMSIPALLDVKDEFNRVYREVAAQTGALLVDLAGALPPTRVYFEDSSHFTPKANRIIGERVGRALCDDPRVQQLLGGANPSRERPELGSVGKRG